MNQEILHRFKTAEVVKCDTARTQQRTHTRPFVILRNHSTADRLTAGRTTRNSATPDPGHRGPCGRAHRPSARAHHVTLEGRKDGTVPYRAIHQRNT